VEPITLGCDVSIEGDNIAVTGLSLHGFRTEMREMLKDVSDRLIRLEAARDARAGEREKSTAAGLDFAAVRHDLDGSARSSTRSTA
jgi:hypothetical protein